MSSNLRWLTQMARGSIAGCDVQMLMVILELHTVSERAGKGSIEMPA